MVIAESINCHCPIKCRACRNWGHVAASCPSSEKFEQRQDPGRSNGKAALVLNPNWFNLERNTTNRPSSSSPPSFNSFGEMSRACFASWATSEIAPALTIPWRLKPTHAEEDQTTNSKELDSPGPCLLETPHGFVFLLYSLCGNSRKRKPSSCATVRPPHCTAASSCYRKHGLLPLFLKGCSMKRSPIGSSWFVSSRQ